MECIFDDNVCVHACVCVYAFLMILIGTMKRVVCVFVCVESDQEVHNSRSLIQSHIYTHTYEYICIYLYTHIYMYVYI